MTKLKLEHVERLTHGKRSGANVGSRAVGHYLRSHERATYQRALKKGYLDITERDRVNLWHVWEKACLATKIDFLVLVKDTQNNRGAVYKNSEPVCEATLGEAKREIRELARAR